MSLYYTSEDGAKVFVQDFYPEDNIYEEKTTLLYVFVKIEGIINIEWLIDNALFTGCRRRHLRHPRYPCQINKPTAECTDDRPQ